MAIGAALVALAAAVSAHGVLATSDPEEGAQLETLPAVIRLTFSEPVEERGTEATLVRAGETVESTYALDDSRPTELTLRPAEPGERPGHYLVVFRTLSAIDGHSRRGSLTFTVLNPDGTAPPGGEAGFSVADSAAPGWLTALVKAGLLLSLVLGVGVALHAVFPLPTSEAGVVPLLRRLSPSLLVAFLVFDLALTAIRIRDSLGFDDAFTFITETRAGKLWLARAALTGSALALWSGLCNRGQARWLLVVFLGTLLGLVSVAGHAGTPPGEVWSVGNDIAHLAAAGVWLGGLTVVGLALIRPSQALDRVIVARAFSVRAVIALVAVLATGLISTLTRVPNLDGLIETRYGLTLVAKVALVFIAVALAFYNSRRIGLLARAASSASARTVVVELVVLLAVVGIAGGLSETATPPGPTRAPAPATASEDPLARFEAERELGDGELTLWIEPARPGPNVVTAFVEIPSAAVVGVSVQLYGAGVPLEAQRLQPSPTGTAFEGTLQALRSAGLYEARVAVELGDGRLETRTIAFEAERASPESESGGLSSPFGSRTKRLLAAAVGLLALAGLAATGLFFVRSGAARLSLKVSSGGAVVLALLMVGAGLSAERPATGENKEFLTPIASPGAAAPETPTPGGSPDPSEPSAWSTETFGAGDGQGLMMPAVDHNGDVWVAAMNHNRLFRFDHHEGTVSAVDLPGSLPPLSTMALDFGADGRVWLAASAGKVSRYDPTDEGYTEYDTGEGSGPTDLEVGADGSVWFTALGAQALGRLNPDTADVRMYPIGIAGAYPYGLALAPDGTVWFTEFVGDRIGHLDPATGVIAEFPLPKHSRPAGIDVDGGGRVWFAEARGDRVGMLDPETGDMVFHELPAGSAVYGVLAASDGAIWMAATNNAVYRFDPASAKLLSLPTEIGAGPFWLTQSPHDGVIWVSLGGSDELMKIEPRVGD